MTVLQDVPIEIPAPVNTIPDQILPSHIVVQRCSGQTSDFRPELLKRLVYITPHYSTLLHITGLCLDSLGSSCLPKKTKVEIQNTMLLNCM